MQKLIFIPQLFFEILQRYCKLVICGILGMADHAHHKRQYGFVGNSDVYAQKKSN